VATGVSDSEAMARPDRRASLAAVAVIARGKLQSWRFKFRQHSARLTVAAAPPLPGRRGRARPSHCDFRFSKMRSKFALVVATALGFAVDHSGSSDLGFVGLSSGSIFPRCGGYLQPLAHRKGFEAEMGRRRPRLRMSEPSLPMDQSQSAHELKSLISESLERRKPLLTQWAEEGTDCYRCLGSFHLDHEPP
jgi:hypothetical protein